MGMLDTIKGLFSFIPFIGSSKKPSSNPSRNTAILRSSSQPSNSREDLNRMSRASSNIDTESVSLPVDKTQFQIALDYMLKIKKDLSKIGEVPEQVKKIAVAMTNVSDSIAEKMGLNKEQLEKISNTFSKQKINLLALFPIKDSLPKMIEFYAKTFNMTDKAMALA